MLFDEPRRPVWWPEIKLQDDWGPILGAHEVSAGKKAGMFLVTDLGLVVARDSDVLMFVPYEAIVGWDQLSKEPISESLRIHLSSGERVVLCFRQNPAGAFAFVQFLINAKAARARQEKTRR